MKLSSHNKSIIKFIIVLILSACSIYALLYYTFRFYTSEILDNNMLKMWVFFGTIILITLIIGVFNRFKLIKIEKQNAKMSATISQIASLIEDYHYSEMSELRNTMECILDLGCEERDNNDK